MGRVSKKYTLTWGFTRSVNPLVVGSSPTPGAVPQCFARPRIGSYLPSCFRDDHSGVEDDEQ